MNLLFSLFLLKCQLTFRSTHESSLMLNEELGSESGESKDRSNNLIDASGGNEERRELQSFKLNLILEF